jgi:hypothetical protein
MTDVRVYMHCFSWHLVANDDGEHVGASYSFSARTRFDFWHGVGRANHKCMRIHVPEWRRAYCCGQKAATFTYSFIIEMVGMIARSQGYEL